MLKIDSPVTSSNVLHPDGCTPNARPIASIAPFEQPKTDRVTTVLSGTRTCYHLKAIEEVRELGLEPL